MSSDPGHLSVDQLADLGADALAPAELANARSHLGSCDECRAIQDRLAAVPTLLAGLAAVPMPAEVTARVVAAIEREQLARADEADRAGALAGRADIGRAGLRRRFGARLGVGLLGAAAVLGVGYLVLPDVLSDENAPTAGIADSAVDAGGDGTLQAPESAGEREYGDASLDQDVARLLQQREVPAAPEAERTPGETVSSQDSEMETFDGTRTTACVAAIQRKAGSQATPLAVDIGTYDGQPAVVVVLPAGPVTSAAAAVEVWVVGTGCVDADLGEVAALSADLDVLAHRSVQR